MYRPPYYSLEVAGVEEFFGGLKSYICQVWNQEDFVGADLLDSWKNVSQS